MSWFTEKPFLWKAAFIVLAVYAVVFEAFIIPSMAHQLFGVSSEAALAGILAVGLVGVAITFGLLFLLAKAPPWAMRGAAAYAALAWGGFSLVLVFFQDEHLPWSPAFAVPGLCAVALLACLVVDLFIKPAQA